MAGKGVWATETCSFIRKLFKPLNYKKKKKKAKMPTANKRKYSLKSRSNIAILEDTYIPNAT